MISPGSAGRLAGSLLRTRRSPLSGSPRGLGGACGLREPTDPAIGFPAVRGDRRAEPGEHVYFGDGGWQRVRVAGGEVSQSRQEDAGESYLPGG